MSWRKLSDTLSSSMGTHSLSPDNSYGKVDSLESCREVLIVLGERSEQGEK